MVLTAKLQIKGHKSENEGIPLLECDYEFKQLIDDRGLSVGKVKGGVIKLTFSSIEDGEIMHWILSQTDIKNGKIEFSGGDDEKVFKTLEFSNAICFYYHEYFTRDQQMIQQISISAQELTISGATIMNNWGKF